MFDVWLFANIHIFGCSLMLETGVFKSSLVRMFKCSFVSWSSNVQMFNVQFCLIYFSQMFAQHKRTSNIEKNSSDFLESLDYPWAPRKKFILRKPYLDYNLERVSLKPNISCCWLVLTLSFSHDAKFWIFEKFEFRLMVCSKWVIFVVCLL